MVNPLYALDFSPLQSGIEYYRTAADKRQREDKFNALFDPMQQVGDPIQSDGWTTTATRPNPALSGMHPAALAMARAAGPELGYPMLARNLEHQSDLRFKQSAEDRTKQLFPSQLSTAQSEAGIKRRELEQPGSKITVIPDGGAAVLTDPRTGQSQTIQANEGGKTPQGYRKTPAGNMEAIPGGPADVKTSEKRQQDFASMQAINQQYDDLEKSANELLKHKGLGGNFGMSGVVPNIPGGTAADAWAKLENLRTQGGFATLQAMRNASKTGGALGAISDKENAMLQNAIAPLQKVQSEKAAREALQKIIDHAQASKARIAAAYEDHWNNAGAAARTPPSQAGAATQPAAAPTKGPNIGYDAKTKSYAYFDPSTGAWTPLQGATSGREAEQMALKALSARPAAAPAAASNGFSMKRLD